jgi:hypothetical protein
MGRGGKRGLTEAERQEITAALLARWDRETQSLIKQARAGPRLSAGNGATVQTSSSANRSRPPEKPQRAPAAGSTRVTSRVRADASDGPQAQQGSSSGRSTNAKPRPKKGPLPDARRSAKRARAEGSLARVNPVAAAWWARANSTPAVKVDACQHVLAWWSCAEPTHPRWREYIDVVARGGGRCPSCGSARAARPRTTVRKGAARKRPEPSRQSEPTPYERAFGVSPLMRKLNPPEAIRDAWR